MPKQWYHVLTESNELDDDPSIICISSDGEYVAIVVGSMELIIYEISDIQSRVSSRCTFEAPEPHIKIVCVLWHPFLPRELLVSFSTGMVHIVTFEPPAIELETRKKINLRRFMFRRRAVQLTALCIDDDATEMSGVMDGKLFSFGDPFINEHFRRASLYNKSIPSRLVQFTGHSPLGLCYLEQGVLLVVYPLGLFAINTTYPNEIRWTIDILPSRMLSSGTMSPDRKLFVGVTETGAVEVYDLQTQRFVVKVGHSDGPFREISNAVFYDRNSLALIHKKGPSADRVPNEPCIDIIPLFRAEERIHYTRLGVTCTRPDLDLNNPPTIALGAGIMDGKPRLIFQRNIFRSVVVVCLEDFPKDDTTPPFIYVHDGHRLYNEEIPAPIPSENDSPRTAEAFRILDEYVEPPWTMEDFDGAHTAAVNAAEALEEERIGELEADFTDGEIHSDDSDSSADAAAIAHAPIDIGDRRLGEAFDEDGQVLDVARPELQAHLGVLAALDAYHNHPISLVACGLFASAIVVTVGLQMV